MENKGTLRADKLILFHFPSLVLIVGYLTFWLELAVFKNNQFEISLLALLFCSCILILLIYKNLNVIVSFFISLKNTFLTLNLFNKILLIFTFVVSTVVLFIGFYASLYPPHLTQEFDVLNYHITLPRQHLISGTFSHIKWSTADLYFMPIDLALIPFWLLTDLPNKIPQYLFYIGLLLVFMRLSYEFSNKNSSIALLAGMSILGTHSIGIQLGTAMLDNINAYLFFAALHSFFSRSYLLSAIEFGFYFWSKSFVPVYFMVTVAIMLSLYLILIFLKANKPVFLWFYSEFTYNFNLLKTDLKKFAISFLIISIIIAGPFIFKSMYYAGTPLYPFALGAFKVNNSINYESKHWQSLKENTDIVLHTSNNYGSGRGVLEFIQHFWLIAVPEKNVNNRYDYPIGLVYLLLVVPFIVQIIKSIQARTFPVLPMWVVASWLTWWLGSQQTRFLTIPLLLMFLVTLCSFKTNLRVLYVFILFAVFTVGFSVFKAHKSVFGMKRFDVLREKDKELVLLSTRGQKSIKELDFQDAAFANFPIKVKDIDSVFVLKE